MIFYFKMGTRSLMHLREDEARRPLSTPLLGDHRASAGGNHSCYAVLEKHDTDMLTAGSGDLAPFYTMGLSSTPKYRPFKESYQNERIEDKLQ